MTSVSVKLTPQGRVSIISQLRRELGWGPETDLVEYSEGSRVIIEPRADMVRRVQDMALGARTESDSVVDDLLATRRSEAAVELHEIEDGH
ncbi:hypothetical protein SAMN04487904_102311 [Actinopolyspora lacussalsi subsp. righensis]|uniref:Looped-hinge helix DNA binding domain-containing protein, AbrB family n=1 Tax=Actinopolyspora righensis TaxID=995060 RepID=A0A1I6Y9I7_9ACTN|nr:hypothetical protein [Actinopolyspora righensis]SFT46941.1 hypothetical protein SAMN04487904_102311 [Actinopolyspora righensis]